MIIQSRRFEVLYWTLTQIFRSSAHGHYCNVVIREALIKGGGTEEHLDVLVRAVVQA